MIRFWLGRILAISLFIVTLGVIDFAPSMAMNSEAQLIYNKQTFGITHPTWVTNSRWDPSTNKIFHRAPPQGTRKISARKIEQQGLYGWYRS